MSKITNARSSRKLAQIEQRKEAERRRARAVMQQLSEEEAQYTHPTDNTEKCLEECRQRLEQGKKCYCKERCSCRNCQARAMKSGNSLCDLETLKQEGGCAFGCFECSKCNPCY